MRRILIPALVGLAILGAAACSPDEGDFKSEAEDFISDEDGDVATQTAMTFEDVECQEPTSTDEGSTFTCSATGSDGQSYTFTGEVTGERSFEIVDIAAGGATTGTAPTATTTG